MFKEIQPVEGKFGGEISWDRMRYPVFKSKAGELIPLGPRARMPILKMFVFLSNVK